MFSAKFALLFATVLVSSVSASATNDPHNHHSIDAAIKSTHTIQILPVPSQHQKDHDAPVVDINSNQLPLTVRFNSHSSNINVVQKHVGHPAKTHNATHTDDPDELIHNVHKPIIQRVHEIVHPYRIITQEIRPAQEKIETIVAQDKGGFRGAQRIPAQSVAINSDAVGAVAAGNNNQNGIETPAASANSIQFANVGQANSDPNNFDFPAFRNSQQNGAAAANNNNNNNLNFDFPGFRTSQQTGAGGNNANANNANFDFPGFRAGQTNTNNAANGGFAGFERGQVANNNANLGLNQFGGANQLPGAGNNGNNNNDLGFARIEVFQQNNRQNSGLEFGGFENSQSSNQARENVALNQNQIQSQAGQGPAGQAVSQVAQNIRTNNNIVITNPNTVDRDESSSQNQNQASTNNENNGRQSFQTADESSLQFHRQEQQQDNQQRSSQNSFMQSKKMMKNQKF